MIRTFQGIKPTVPPSCFIEETAVVIGDVVMGEDCSAWFHAVIRGDDCLETIDVQFDYLHDAVFASVEVVWQQDLWAVLVARKP